MQCHLKTLYHVHILAKLSSVAQFVEQQHTLVLKVVIIVLLLLTTRFSIGSFQKNYNLFIIPSPINGCGLLLEQTWILCILKGCCGASRLNFFSILEKENLKFVNLQMYFYAFLHHHTTRTLIEVAKLFTQYWEENLWKRIQTCMINTCDLQNI